MDTDTDLDRALAFISRHQKAGILAYIRKLKRPGSGFGKPFRGF